MDWGPIILACQIGNHCTGHFPDAHPRVRADFCWNAQLGYERCR